MSSTGIRNKAYSSLELKNCLFYYLFVFFLVFYAVDG
jgi:hypothetical protein